MLAADADQPIRFVRQVEGVTFERAPEPLTVTIGAEVIGHEAGFVFARPGIGLVVDAERVEVLDGRVNVRGLSASFVGPRIAYSVSDGATTTLVVRAPEEGSAQTTTTAAGTIVETTFLPLGPGRDAGVGRTNDGRLVFIDGAVAGELAVCADASHMVAIDVDGDADVDLLVACADRFLRLVRR